MNIELKIILDDAGRVQVQGPIDQTMICYGLLEMARDALRAHAEARGKAAIVPPRLEDMAALGRKA